MVVPQSIVLPLLRHPTTRLRLLSSHSIVSRPHSPSTYPRRRLFSYRPCSIATSSRSLSHFFPLQSPHASPVPYSRSFFSAFLHLLISSPSLILVLLLLPPHRDSSPHPPFRFLCHCHVPLVSPSRADPLVQTTLPSNTATTTSASGLDGCRRRRCCAGGQVRSLWRGRAHSPFAGCPEDHGPCCGAGGAEGMLSSLAVLVHSGALDVSGVGGRRGRTDVLGQSLRISHSPAPLRFLSLRISYAAHDKCQADTPSATGSGRRWIGSRIMVRGGQSD
ncbi:hypothetical protein C8F01DRAFT_768747 [Mycena amicta]|nr:hypothetical protein C8F01DRAFT_768747 [Mycena amicta]